MFMFRVHLVVLSTTPDSCLPLALAADLRVRSSGRAFLRTSEMHEETKSIRGRKVVNANSLLQAQAGENMEPWDFGLGDMARQAAWDTARYGAAGVYGRGVCSYAAKGRHWEREKLWGGRHLFLRSGINPAKWSEWLHAGY